MFLIDDLCVRIKKFQNSNVGGATCSVNHSLLWSGQSKGVDGEGGGVSNMVNKAQKHPNRFQHPPNESFMSRYPPTPTSNIRSSLLVKLKEIGSTAERKGVLLILTVSLTLKSFLKIFLIYSIFKNFFFASFYLINSFLY